MNIIYRRKIKNWKKKKKKKKNSVPENEKGTFKDTLKLIYKVRSGEDNVLED